MILLELMPCSNCKNYGGIEQQNKSEIGEYIQCKVAKSKNAGELLETTNKRATCKYQEKIDNG